MSPITFQQECQNCHKTWTVTFGIVGIATISDAPAVCPNCGSNKVHGKWDIPEGSGVLHEHTHDIGGEG
jgi:hypothetical protein